MFWLAAPLLTGAIATTVGGCNEANSLPPQPAVGATTIFSPRFAVASTKRGPSGRSERSARNVATFASAPGAFPSYLRGSSSETPLEQLLRDGDRPLANNGLCPADMATIDDLFCVDRYEASLVEILPNGEERGWSPYLATEGHIVRAVSEPSVIPQAYMSGVQAADACARSGKRLCKPSEWRKACKGPDRRVYGYGNQNEARRCNDHGRGPVTILYGSAFDPSHQREWNWERMNRPELNQLEGTLAPTGSHEGCTNGYGVYDMVGNLHEWVADPKGTFQGGYYQDTHINGDGCDYVTKAHEVKYHDYSTGFRCCADVAP